MSSLNDAHPFQNDSNAFIKSDLGVSIQDNSSIKIILRVWSEFLIKSFNSSNAINQFVILVLGI